jgi:hypothetical protein
MKSPYFVTLFEFFVSKGVKVNEGKGKLMKTKTRIWIVATAMGLVSSAGAEELIGTPSGQPVAVSTASVTPVAVSTAPAVASPVVVTTGPLVAPVVATPADANRQNGAIAWKKLEGTVQSVDRANHQLQIQDRQGSNVNVALNDKIHIYRGGEEVASSDVNPNDSIVIRYEAQRP